MIDPVKILQRAWHILWNYRTLWIFGLILALAAGGAGGNGGNNGIQWQQDAPSTEAPPQAPPPESFQEGWEEFTRELDKLFQQGIPEMDISGEALVTFLWLIGIFIVLMLLLSLVMAIARYVSEVAVIRMVDEYENSGTKMTVREGFRIGWSPTAWRLFLINLIVNLPAIIFFLALLIGGVILFLSIVNGNAAFTAISGISMVGLLFTGICAVILVSIVLGLLRYFFWRVAVLENAGVGESLRGGFAMVRQNWKSVGIMWLVMFGLGIAWAIVSIIAAIVTLPLVLITTVLAAIVAAIPGLLLYGLFSLFLSGPLTWITAGIFVLPLFFIIAFSPWILLGSWQMVFTSTVWTLTYREIKALPPTLIAPETDIEPVGD